MLLLVSIKFAAVAHLVSFNTIYTDYVISIIVAGWVTHLARNTEHLGSTSGIGRYIVGQ